MLYQAELRSLPKRLGEVKRTDCICKFSFRSAAAARLGENLVEPRRLELLTFSLRTRRSTNWSYTPQMRAHSEWRDAPGKGNDPHVAGMAVAVNRAWLN